MSLKLEMDIEAARTNLARSCPKILGMSSAYAPAPQSGTIQLAFLYFTCIVAPVNVVQSGAAVLSAAESELKQLAAEAVAANEWAAVSALAGWAELLRALIDEAGYAEVRQGPNRQLAPMTREKGAAPTHGHTSTSTQDRESSSTHSRSPGKRNREKSTASDYPRFARESECLIKIGWSKKSKKEYEHRAPRSLLDQIVEVVTRLAANGSKFTVDDLLPLLEQNGGGPIPNYQTYLCIAWLREHDILEQHGRQGYSILPNRPLQKLVARAWATTPDRG